MTAMPPFPPPPLPAGLSRPSSKWPTPIGIISLVIAGLAVVGALLGPLIQGAMESMPGGNVMAHMPEDLRTTQRLMMIPGLLANLCLGIGGFLLLKRMAASRILFFIYAILAVLMIIPNTWLAQEILKATLNATPVPKNARPEQVEMIRSMTRTGGSVGVFIGVAYAAAYPVFLLVWFLRGKIRDEVRTWAAEAKKA